MKLQTKARIPIAALGVAALCAGGLGAFATAAHAAPAPIGLNSGGTSPAVANVGTATVAAANAAYALKITDASIAGMAAGLVTAPTGGALAVHKAASNAPASTSFTTLSGTGAGADEVQTATITGGPTGGTFTLTYSGQTTSAIAYNATAAAVQGDLEALSNLAPGDVTVTGSAGGPYTLTFGGALAKTDVAALTASGASLTGGTAPSVAITTPTQGSAAAAVTLGAVVNTDYVYVTGTVPGAYTFRLFQDTNANLVHDVADERATDLITLTVYDAGGTGTTVSASDDVAPVVAASTPVNVGRSIKVGLTYSKPLSLSDARGSGVATGLAGRLAALTFVDAVPANGLTGIIAQANEPASYSTTDQTITYTVGTPSTAGTLGVRADLKSAAGAPENVSFGSKSIVVATNNVTDLALEATEVDGKVEGTGSTVAAKAGTETVTYTATAINDQGNGNAADDTPVSGATVYFTLAGDNVADLTTDGTAVPGETHVFTATTNASGVATLKVTSSATADTDAYTVDADSNGVDNGADLTVTYAAAAAAGIEVANTVAELTPEASATSVAIKGRLIDQFGAAFTPSSSQPQQVTVQVPDGVTAGFATITEGAFSYTYTPTTPPAAGDSVTFDFLYGGLADGATEDGTIRFASTAAATAITLTTPAEGATAVTLQDNTAPNAAQVNGGTPPFGNSTGAVTGTVYGEGNTLLAYKAVTLAGDDGVYFSTSATPSAANELVKTLDVVTDASGVISGAFVFFTESGEATVTAKSGSVTASATVTTLEPAGNQGYRISVNDVTSSPGSTVIVTGAVRDVFGNPVPNAPVDLSTGASTIGALGDPTLSTNADGIFSTTFVSGSNQSGEVELTATLAGQTANAVPDPAFALAGIELEDGQYTDAGTITVAEVKIEFQATGKLVGGGDAEVSGSFRPNITVEIFAKPSGAESYQQIDSLEADAEGEFGASYPIKKTTRFLAKASGMSSKVATTEVWSKVTLTAKSTSKGRATLAANGAPSAKGTLTFYRSVAGKDPILRTMTSNASGNGTVTVKLPKGERKVYVIFKAPGTGAGTSKSVAVQVK